MATVYSPVQGFSGQVVPGAVFSNGVAEVENASALAYLQRKGYSFDAPPEGVQVEPEPEDIPEHVEPEVTVPGMPGSNASRGELAAFAEGMGVETEGLTMAQIRTKIKAQAAS